MAPVLAAGSGVPIATKNPEAGVMPAGAVAE
jgi:hypothetical protein